jgi:hypothetical protein
MEVNFDYNGLANEVINRGISLADDFGNWTKLAFSLSTLGEDGRGIFKALSSMSDNYKERENDMKFTNALRTNHGTDISTFVWLCKQKGIDVKKFTIKDGDRHTATLQPIQKRKQSDEPQPLQIDYIPKKYVLRSVNYNSDFVLFLLGLFGNDEMTEVMENYSLGATKDRAVIFWQIDANGMVRTGKVMKYNSDSGHRIHDGGTNWIHALLMRKQGKQPTDYHLKQCLFGEHLLRKYPNKNVALVEAEKSAVIGSVVYPHYIWLATGGKGNMQTDRLKALAGRNVTLFPDTDATGSTFQDWSNKAKEMRAYCNNVYVSDILEKHATAEDKADKIDIADWLISYLTLHPMIDAVTVLSAEERKLLRWEERNPAIKLLVEKLDLELVKN